MVQRQSVQRQRIGPAIRRLRQERMMTLDALAAAAGISASHLSRLERSQTLPSFTVLAKIAEVLGVNVDEFVRLERDVTRLDRELQRYLDMLGLPRPLRDELFDLSIEARRGLVVQLTQLAESLLTSYATQEAAARALAERGVPEVWKPLSRLVRQSGLSGSAFARGWMRLVETPGSRLALITDRSFFMLPPEADFLRAFRAAFPDVALDPVVVSWWESSDWLRGEALARRWPTRVILRRSLLEEALDGGQFAPGAEPDRQAAARLVERLLDRLVTDRGFELALTDGDLGPFNFLFVNNETGMLERPVERRPRETATRVGIWLNGQEMAGGYVGMVNAVWDELPAADKDRESIATWLRGHASARAA